MSSTKRGGRKPRKDGNYATPLWAVRVVLPLLPMAKRILDPAAGKGNILRAVADYYGDRDKPDVLAGIELNPERAQKAAVIDLVTEVICANALLRGIEWNSPQLIIMNPPFSLAEIFVRRALKEVTPDGMVCVLLPVPFVSSGSRKGFWDGAAADFHKEKPDMHILTRRPSFTKIGESSNDSVEYAWFLFSKQSTGKWNRLEPEEPKAARSRRLDVLLEPKPSIVTL